MTEQALNFLGRKQGTILKLMLALIVVIFIGILIAVYFVARGANPILLDETGKPIHAQTRLHP